MEKPKFRIPIFRKLQSLEFHCFEKATFTIPKSEKPKTRIPVFGKSQIGIPMLIKGKIQKSNISKIAKFGIPMFGKRQNLEIQCLEKGRIYISNVWKMAKVRTPLFRKAKIYNSKVWKSKV